MSPAGDGLLISLSFWAAFVAYLPLERGLEGWLPQGLRYALCSLASAGFLWYFTSIGSLHLAALYLALAAIYLGARVALAGQRRPAGALLLFPGAAVALWALGKIGSSLALDGLAMLFFVGASFVLVKIWTFCKDLRDGRIERPELFAFVAYCSFFPCFLSGPMHYYGEFRQTFEGRQPLDGATFVDALFRIFHGLVKVLILAVALRPFSLEVLRAGGFSEVGPLELVARSLVYSLVIYLDFSGYSDVAIAAGSLLGVRVPENFRMPYLARDLREFWQRWHITFTRFLTQYLFIPTARLLTLRARGASQLVTSAIAYLATFLFCGFWHGSTANFLVWGFYHGAGMVIVDQVRRRRLAAGRRPSSAPLHPMAVWAARGVGIAATFLFVSLGWIFFVLPMGFWSR